MKWQGHKSIPSAVSFSAASYLAMAISLVQGLVLSRILGPERLGTWISLMLIVTYGQHFHLGIVNAVNRTVPLLLGKGSPAEADAYVDTAASALVRLTRIWIVISVAASLAIFRAQPIGAVVVCLVAVAEVWFQMYVTLLKTHGRFGVVGVLNVSRAVLTFGLLPVVGHWAMSGLYLRAAAVAVGSVIAAAALSPRRLNISRPKGFERQILVDGFPLLLVGMVFSVQISLDRLLIASLLGAVRLGEYSLATMLLSVMIVIPGVVGITSYPDMLRQLGANGHGSILRPRVCRQTLFILIVSCAAAFVAYFLIGPLVRLALPAYVAGIQSAQWLLPGIAMLAASMPASYFLQAVRRQRAHLVVSIAAVVTHAIVVIGVVRENGGLVAVSIATSVAYAVYAVALFGAFLRYSRISAVAPELASEK